MQASSAETEGNFLLTNKTSFLTEVATISQFDTPLTTTLISSASPDIHNLDFEPQPSKLGIAIEKFDNESGLAQMLPLQVKWARRSQLLSWRDVEPNEGQYNWSSLTDLENELLIAKANQIEPTINIQFTPSWAQKVPPYTCGPIRADKFEAFANFMEQVVIRYGSASSYGVHYWQIGNELDVAPEEVAMPDNPFGCWGDPEDAYFGGGHYAEMLKVVYPRVKAADPQAQIIIGGLLLQCDPYITASQPDCTDSKRMKSGLFLEGIMREGGGNYFDVADVHSYALLRLDLPQKMHSYYDWSRGVGGTGLPEKVRFMRREMGKYGYSDKPLMAGELALKCEEPTAECYDIGAAFIPRVYAETYHLDLLNGIYFALISEFKFKGLLLPDLTPKPAYHAFEFMSSQLTESRYERPVDNYQGVSGYLFEKPDLKEVAIIWSTDGLEQTITLPSNIVSAFDKSGTPLITVSDQLAVDWSPIYLVSQPISITLTTASLATTLFYTDSQKAPTQLDFPPNVVSQTVDIFFKPTVAKADAPNTTFANHTFELLVYQNGISQTDFTFNQPVTVTLRYTDADVRLISDKDQLSLYWWDGLQWVEANQSCVPPPDVNHDLNNRTLIVSICRSGQFALFGPTKMTFLPVTIRRY